MSRKAVQVLAGLVMLLGWGVLGAYGIPTARLESLMNFPNPFDSRHAATTIFYTLDSEARVAIRVYDLSGAPIRTWNFYPGEAGARAGENRIAWDGSDESGQKVAAGGYVCQVLVEQESGVMQGVRKVGVIH
jgi:hypothetical protein